MKNLKMNEPSKRVNNSKINLSITNVPPNKTKNDINNKTNNSKKTNKKQL